MAIPLKCQRARTFNSLGNLPKTDHILEYETNLNPVRNIERTPCIPCAYPGMEPKMNRTGIPSTYAQINP